MSEITVPYENATSRRTDPVAFQQREAVSDAPDVWSHWYDSTYESWLEFLDHGGDRGRRLYEVRALYAATPDVDAVAAQLASLTQRVKEVVDAAIQLSERAFDSYKAGNGRMVSIQGDDGEKCWIVHSDDLHALETAIADVVQATGLLSPPREETSP